MNAVHMPVSTMLQYWNVVHHFLVYTAGGGKSGNFDGVYMKSILSYFTAVHHTKALNNASHRAALNGKHNKYTL